MELSELLKGMNADEIVYIGSASAFVFIGPVHEAIEKINAIGDEHRDHWKELHEKYGSMLIRLRDGSYEESLKKRLKYSQDTIVSLMEQLAIDPEERKTKRTDASLQAEIKRRKAGCVNFKKSIEKIPQKLNHELSAFIDVEERLDRYKPMMERKVNFVYPRRFAEPLGMIIVVEGDECGEYWDLEEYQKKKKTAGKDEVWDLGPEWSV